MMSHETQELRDLIVKQSSHAMIIVQRHIVNVFANTMSEYNCSNLMQNDIYLTIFYKYNAELNKMPFQCVI